MAKKKESELFLSLKDYVENRPVAIKAAGPLKNGACVGVSFAEEPGNHFHFIREEKKSHLRTGLPEQSDFDMHLPLGTVEELVNFKSEKIPDIGATIFTRALMDNEEERLQITLHKGPLKLARLGYMGVVGKGGLAVFKIIRKHGLMNVAKARKVFKFSDKWHDD
jgi:hypothetical protein